MYSLVFLFIMSVIQPIFADEKIENLHRLWSQKDVSSLFEQVERLHYSGQFVEAHTLIDYLMENEFSEDVYFLWGQNLEYRKDFVFAIEIYEELLSEDIDPLLALDVRYRLGIALDDSNAHRLAIRNWNKLRKDKDFPPEHLPAVELLLGAAYIHNGQHKKGVLLITNALPRANRSQDWMKARARNALAMICIQQADSIELLGWEVQKDIETRMRHLKKAEEQVIASVHLNKTAYILQGIIQMVDAYLRLYDDARTIAPPHSISSAKEDMYFRRLEKKSRSLLLRAENYLEKGMTISRRQNWKGIESKQLQNRLSAVRAEKKRRED